jgi:hypothetical protein
MSEVQLVPSPLAGEGVTVVQRILMGEGLLRETYFGEATPSPDRARCNTELPSPARGEGANAGAVPAAEL